MSSKVTIEVDAQTAELLKARASARGISVADLLADLAGEEAPLPPALNAMRAAGEGPWAPDMLAEDARRLAEFRRTRDAIPLGRGEGVDAKLGHAAGTARAEAAQIVKLIVSSDATADLERLRAFLADKNAAAQRAVASLIQAIDTLAMFPDRGAKSAVPGMRELIVPFGRSAYVVRFAHDAE
jgi:plasmid stabilization system protein ParE